MGVIGWVLVAFIALQPIIGRWRWRRFLARRHEPGARLELYRRAIAVSWGATALIAGAMVRAHLPPAAIGLALPSGASLPGATVVALLVGLFLLVLVAPVSTAARRETLVRAFGDASEILPRTRSERAWFVVVAFTAGFCEELLYRGFLIVFVHGYAPSLPSWGYVLVSAVPFGLAHGYQGKKGMVGTGLLGAFFAGLTLYTRSLWPAIVLHTLVDLRAALLIPPAAASASGRAPA